MGGIERYETWMARFRDGAWFLGVASAVVGFLTLGEALILSGLAWFGLALLAKAPCALYGMRPLVAGRWRAINRLLLVHVAVITLVIEAVRGGYLTPGGYGAALMLVPAFLLIATVMVFRRKTLE
ncbi:MAG: hypothetical protein ACO1SV_04685 [Fimbriimonas sp.]